MHPDFDPALVGRLAALLSDVTGVPAGALSASSSRDATAGWDSVANLQFISAVEEEFGVIIPTAAVMKLRSLGDMARFLQESAGQGHRPTVGTTGQRSG